MPLSLGAEAQLKALSPAIGSIILPLFLIKFIMSWMLAILSSSFSLKGFVPDKLLIPESAIIIASKPN